MRTRTRPPVESPLEWAISAADLTVQRDQTTVLSDITLDVPARSRVAVIGPNGSGKTTLLKAIAGLLRPAGGSLLLPAGARRGGVAMVLQSTDVDDSLPITVRDVVRLARYPSLGLLRRFRAADRAEVDHALERVGAADLARQQFSALSGGQRQRVLVAQGLAQRADLLLLDEPFTGLDLPSQDQIGAIIDEEVAGGATVVLSTHDLADAAACDLVVLLATRQIAFGPPDEVLREGPLKQAFGGRVMHMADGSLLVDDPHHEHDHDHGH